MLLTVKNIGKISDASIEIDGITVIAGENNTGKSTIGKILYCLFNSFYNNETKINKERVKGVESEILNFFRNSVKSSTLFRGMRARYALEKKVTSEIFVNFSTKIDDIDSISSKIVASLSSEKLNNDDMVIDEKELLETSKRILAILTITDSEILTIILDKYFMTEFNSQINHINNVMATASAKLENNQKYLTTEFINNKCNNYTGNINIITEAIYIDTPLILDESDEFLQNFNTFYHRDHLMSKLKSIRDQASKNILDQAINAKKLESLMNKIASIVDGEFMDVEGSSTFKESSLIKPLVFSNLSTGLKSFLILKKLIENGDILDNGVLILDEPEVHLHPEWQLAYAEILVLIQKEFNLNIVLNTHSPYFLNAIEVYSAKYEIANKCKYYLSSLVDKYAIFQDVTNETDLIYKKLAKPLQILENLKYEI